MAFAEKATTSIVNNEYNENVKHNEQLLGKEKDVGLENGIKRPYLTLAEIWNLPKKKWALSNWFGRGDVGIIFGDSASGKTFVAICLMVSAMLEQTFAKKFEFSNRLKCLYVCGEGFSGAMDRIKARLSMQRLPNDINDYFFTQREVPNLTDERNVKAFIEAYKDLDIGIIVIDTLNIACYGANENDASAMGLVFKHTQDIAKALNATVILLHHANKSNGGYRGSTAIRASCDFAIKVEVDGKTRSIECDKLKDGEQWDKQNFTLKGIDLPDGGRSAVITWSEPGQSLFTAKDAVVELLKKHPEDWYTYKEIYNELRNEKADTKIDAETIQKYCNDLFDEKKFIKEEERKIRNNSANYQSKVYQINKASF